jgi:hypothetical protein
MFVQLHEVFDLQQFSVAFFHLLEQKLVWLFYLHIWQVILLHLRL